MPFCVRPISPARNALLLLVSSQDSVPGMKVSYSAWAYFSASTVSGLSITTWSFSSTSLPPCDHTTQVHQALPSPTALPSARPGGWPFALSFWQSSRKPAGSSGTASKPASLTQDLRYTQRPPEAPIGMPIQRPSLVPYFSAIGHQPP